MKSILICIGIALFCCLDKKSTHTSTPTTSDKEVVCFVYHRFDDKRYPSTNTKTKDFEAHLQYLKAQNYQVLTLADAIDYLQSDKSKRNTAVITIDDGYKSFYENGLPLLKKYHMPATLFINTKTVGASDFMDWQELKQLLKDDVEIGNHTHAHNYFLNEDVSTRYKTFEEEINHSQSIIKQNLEITPKVFSFPYGEFDERMEDIVKRKGFKCAAAQNSGVLGSTVDIFHIPRFPMSEAYASPKDFIAKAKTHALKITRQSPMDHVISKDNMRPVLTLTFNPTNLRTDQLQCFIQGATCSMNVIKKTEDEITVTLQASHNLATRRRTIYTLTVPDKKGEWYWFSHLWVNAKIK